MEKSHVAIHVDPGGTADRHNDDNTVKTDVTFSMHNSASYTHSATWN